MRVPVTRHEGQGGRHATSAGVMPAALHDGGSRRSVQHVARLRGVHVRGEGGQAKNLPGARPRTVDVGHRRGVGAALHAEAAAVAVGGIGGHLGDVVHTCRRVARLAVPIACGAHVPVGTGVAIGLRRVRCRVSFGFCRRADHARCAHHGLEGQAGEQYCKDQATQVWHRREDSRACPASWSRRQRAGREDRIMDCFSPALLGLIAIPLYSNCAGASASRSLEREGSR